MTNEEEHVFKTAVECHICGQQYKETHIRVRDHCHITGSIGGLPTRTVICGCGLTQNSSRSL